MPRISVLEVGVLDLRATCRHCHEKVGLTVWFRAAHNAAVVVVFPVPVARAVRYSLGSSTTLPLPSCWWLLEKLSVLD
jgi:hypothetical protein